MTARHLPALALSALLASVGFLTAPATADKCSGASVGGPASCAFECDATNSPIISVSGDPNARVEGSAHCPTTSATCWGIGRCLEWGPPETQTGMGTCSGWASSGEAVITCIGGIRGGQGLAFVAGECNADLFALLDAAFVVSIGLDASGRRGKDSFVWSPVGGCVNVVPGCEAFGYRSGPRGIFCGIGPGFAWHQPPP